MTDPNNAAQAAAKEIHRAFELSYAMDADDPANTSDLSHFTNGWRACIMSQVRAEGVQADEPAADAVVRQCPRCTGNGTILRLSGNGPDAYDVQEECSHCEGSGVVASAPVVPAEVLEALDYVDDFIARCNGNNRGSCESVNILRRALASAPVASDATPHTPAKI